MRKNNFNLFTLSLLIGFLGCSDKQPELVKPIYADKQDDPLVFKDKALTKPQEEVKDDTLMSEAINQDDLFSDDTFFKELVEETQIPDNLQTLRVEYEREMPKGGSSYETYQQRVVRTIDFGKNLMREDTHPYGETPRTDNTYTTLTSQSKIYTVANEDRTIFSERTNNQANNKKVWASHTLQNYLGTESFLGKECQVYDNGQGWKIWLWHGISLKEVQKNKDGQVYRVEATYIDENAFFEDDYLLPNRKPKVTQASKTNYDACRLDKEDGSNISRNYYSSEQDCLANLCEILGPSNADKGTASECIFEGRTIKRYRASIQNRARNYKTRQSSRDRYRTRRSRIP